MRPIILIDVLLLIVTPWVILSSWLVEITLDTQYIPTVINGLTASISLIAGFTIAIITIGISQQLLLLDEHKDRIFITLFLVALSFASLWSTYSRLATAEFGNALRFSMTGFNIAMATLVDVTFFILIFAQRTDR